MGVSLISDFSVCYQEVVSRLESIEPCFLARIGGSDTDLIAEYAQCLEDDNDGEAARVAASGIERVAQFNGYYDISKSVDNAVLFCQTLILNYRSCRDLFVGGTPWVSTYFPGSINKIHHRAVSESRELSLFRFSQFYLRSDNIVRLYPRPFAERILLGKNTLFQVMSKSLCGKRVLVISPFSDSTKANFKNRRNFIKDFDYPEFELLCFDTPVTYAGIPERLFPHHNWHQTLRALIVELETFEFDIALLSCGSYAMPLGCHIRDNLKRKAIYGGGVMQLFFGIMGRRYNDPYFLDQINCEAFITPLERDRYLDMMPTTDDALREAFGAYF